MVNGRRSIAARVGNPCFVCSTGADRKCLTKMRDSDRSAAWRHNGDRHNVLSLSTNNYNLHRGIASILFPL